MVLDEILTPSELRYVMDDIKHFPSSFIENSVPVQQLLSDPLSLHQQLLSDPLDGGGSSHMYDSDNSDVKPSYRRKRPKLLCDSTLNLSSGMETIPCLEPYPGMYNFELHLPSDNAAHRWTYSSILRKVFIDIDKVLALQFRWNYSELNNEEEMFVRAMPVYTSHDSLNIPVTRCPIHLLPDNLTNIGFPHMEHVMRCEHSSTSYEKDFGSQRLSCRTPLSRPQPGSDTTTLTYKFVCKTSCLSGMNRKPISVIFTLEDANCQEYGRQQLAVKICSCPKRDKGKEEKNEMEKSESASRVMSISEPVPTMVCVRNAGSDSAFNAGDPLRDIKNVHYNGTERCVVSNHSTPAGSKYPKPYGKVRKSADDDQQNLKDMMLKVTEMVKELKKPQEEIKNMSRHKFLSYIDGMMSELPEEAVLVCEAEITKVLHGIDGLHPYIFRTLLRNLYESFVGKTIRCNLTDTDDIIYQLQTQLDEHLK